MSTDVPSFVMVQQHKTSSRLARPWAEEGPP